MASALDFKITRYGTPGLHEPVNKPLGVNVTVAAGAFGLTDSSGLVKDAASPASTDTVWGLIQRRTVNGASSAALGVEIETGSFYLNSGSGSDALTEANVGQAVYVINENTVGHTNGGGTRPIAGTLIDVKTDGTVPGGYAVRVGNAPPGTGAP